MLNPSIEYLSDDELLSIITDNPTATQKFIDSNPDLYRALANLKNIPDADSELTKKYKKKLEACVELSNRFQKGQNPKLQNLKKPSDVALYLSSEMQYLEYEQFVVLSLNIKNQLIGKNIISIGSNRYTTVSIKAIIYAAMKHNAVKIIVAHNHPSGDIKPSDIDINLTENIRAASSLMGIPLVDHIIIGNGNYYSFAENDLLQEEENAENNN